MTALRQRKKQRIEAMSTRDKNDIVRNRPHRTRTLQSRRIPILIVLLPHARRPNRHPSLDPHTAVEPRKTHPVAKGMGQHTGIHVPRPYINESSKEAKQGRVRELKQGSQDGHGQRNLWVSDAKLVEMVEMGDAKVERGQEDDLFAGEVGEHVQGDDAGSPDDFFAYGADDEVSVPNPTGQCLADTL